MQQWTPRVRIYLLGLISSFTAWNGFGVFAYTAWSLLLIFGMMGMFEGLETAR